ncbi:hypothetical protein [Staphylococcus hominis]|uniref:hypothetical protein n=1 Tax=Staphylococcus hominis TaxID=1290 RepID=UPI001F57CE4A|nr:hypothetical protein [Staphylococcus hominis]
MKKNLKKEAERMYIDSSASFIVVNINLILKLNKTTKYIIDYFGNISIIKLYI